MGSLHKNKRSTSVFLDEQDRGYDLATDICRQSSCEPREQDETSSQNQSIQDQAYTERQSLQKLRAPSKKKCLHPFNRFKKMLHPNSVGISDIKFPCISTKTVQEGQKNFDFTQQRQPADQMHLAKLQRHVKDTVRNSSDLSQIVHR